MGSMPAISRDPFLGARLSRRLPKEPSRQAQALLTEIDQAGAELDVLSFEANAHPPTLRTHDRFGEPLHDVIHHPSYRQLEDFAYGRFGLVSMLYDPAERRRWGGHARTISAAGSLAFGRYEQGVLCPLAMTDGAGHVLAAYAEGALRDRYVPLLGARGSGRHTGMMFLTERQGGSDVGAIESRAQRDGDAWRLYGEKWFASNAGGDLALVLARPDGAPAGTRGLGLFAVPRTLADHGRNAYQIRRLKDKLGTRSMATGEIELAGAKAFLVGQLDAGWKQMASMVNLSRLYNGLAAVAIMSRAYAEALAWAEDRKAFGRTIAQYPMVMDTLDALAAELDGAQALAFEVVGRFERFEDGADDDTDRALLRILTPVLKLFTAKRAIWSASEAIEMLGGNGYVEDFRLPCFLRDAQVLPIWEGTTNILVLDTFRAVEKESAHEPLFDLMRANLARSPDRQLGERLAEHADELESALAGLRGLEGDAWTVPGRQWVFKLAPALEACLLLGEAGLAVDPDRESLVAHARRLVETHLEGWTAMGLLARRNLARR